MLDGSTHGRTKLSHGSASARTNTTEGKMHSNDRTEIARSLLFLIDPQSDRAEAGAGGDRISRNRHVGPDIVDVAAQVSSHL